MIAACPKCAARYRVERERLEAGVVRLRCSRCEAVFRVRPPVALEAKPPAPATTPVAPALATTPVAPKLATARVAPPPATTPVAPPPATTPVAPVREGAAVAARPALPLAASASPATASGDSVLLAMRDAELAKRTAELLAGRGCTVLYASDGVEAMLEIQRKLPRAVVLGADLPKMFGFQICEILKRNPSLRGTFAVLVGAIHHPDRYRREADDLYGADAYLESPDLPEGLLPLLERGGIRLGGATPAPVAQPRTPEPPRPAAEKRAPALPAALRATRPVEAHAPSAAPRTAAVAPPVAAPPPLSRPDDGLEAERAKAERLARIVISDIVLYNEARFAAAARAGNVFEAMAADLAEGRALFQERIDSRVRAERDHLKDELLRSAKLRGLR